MCYRNLILSIFLAMLMDSGNSQTFLDVYKKYMLKKAEAISNSKTKKKIKRFIKSQIVELDTIFKSYQYKNNFNFNTADTLFLIYYSPAESPYTSDIIIWSGRDTISYKQVFETIKPFKYRRTITYAPFISRVETPQGMRVITERDSLITLVSRRDFETINHLGDNLEISDGSYVTIYIVYKDKGLYKIESCSPKQFIIRDTYRPN